MMSPLLWNLAFDNLLNRYIEVPIEVQGLGDDIVLLSKGPDILILVDKGQEAIKKALEFGGQNDLAFGAGLNHKEADKIHIVD